MQKLIYFLPLTLIALFTTACDESLDESELYVFDKALADKIYAENIEEGTWEVGDYLWNAVDVYADQLGDETQREIDEYNASSALWGGSLFDVNELFGSSAGELYAERYYKFTGYANEHREDFVEDCQRISSILQNNPEVLDDFFSADSDISLSLFQKVEGLPLAITADQFESFRSVELNKSNRAKWGTLVMGTLQNPSYSPLAVLCAMVIRVKKLKYPRPVYAVYKGGEDFDDEDGWEVGYDTKQAYFVTFKEDDDVLEYTYGEVDYFDGYVESKKNRLK